MTLLVTGYASKKEIKACLGKPLKYQETSAFGPQYRDNGTFAVAHRPSLGYQNRGREFFAEVTMKDGLIYKVT
jgi:hypothetical protein